ncbi:MAG: hypothetical protein ACXWUG_22890 [Polyangiales bacterium]
MKSPVSDAAMTKAGCANTSKKPGAYLMKCPDGSKFFWSDANPDIIMCEGAASDEDKCRAAIETYGGKSGAKLD